MVLEDLALATLRRSVAHEVTVGAGRRVRIRHRPAMARTGQDFVVLTRIAASGVQPALLRIVADDLTRQGYAISLGPELVSEQPLLGGATDGVSLEVSNLSASDAVLVVHSAPIGRDVRDRLLGGGGGR
ncbi:MAG: hypothetical protein OXH14_03235 [Alphaproteobacteria bacterium]|nr:hypothetical protein [Alphaproteobacteria bacterium]